VTLAFVSRQAHERSSHDERGAELKSHALGVQKYHVVFIPKCRRKLLFGEIRRELGGVFRRLAEQRECQIEEGHLMPDHVHMMISVPPKYAVSQNLPSRRRGWWAI